MFQLTLYYCHEAYTVDYLLVDAPLWVVVQRADLKLNPRCDSLDIDSNIPLVPDLSPPPPHHFLPSHYNYCLIYAAGGSSTRWGKQYGEQSVNSDTTAECFKTNGLFNRKGRFNFNIQLKFSITLMIRNTLLGTVTKKEPMYNFSHFPSRLSTANFVYDLS